MFDIVITKDLLNNVKGKCAPKAEDNIMRYIIRAGGPFRMIVMPNV